MDNKFKCFRKQYRRRSLKKEVSTLEEVRSFFQQELYPFVGYDDKFFSTVEELEEYVKSVRSEFGIEFDKADAGRDEVFESSYRELSKSDSDRTESSSERDN